MRLFLVGFMCSGKSRIGRGVAPLLGLPFVDIDRVIEERVGPIAPFFQREGEAAFRAVEADVLSGLLAGPGAVVATGGGTPCSGDHMERMKAAGTVLWLDVPIPALMPRITAAGGDRPLLMGLKGEALEKRVRELYGPRETFYQQAHLRVPADAPPTEVVDRVVREVRAQAR